MIDVLFEAELKRFKHVIELMRKHEELEDSKLIGVKLMTEDGCTISIHSLEGSYETQSCFHYLIQHGSPEGRLEVLLHQ